MTGIISYGVYVPFNRLSRAQLGQIYGKKTIKGEKAVACYDEDSFTLALSAAQNSLSGKGDLKLDAAFFATTTAPNLEKQTASQIISVLDREGPIRAADFVGSLRAGASAFLSAIDIASKGGASLVSVADTRLAAADGNNEVIFGDAAAAFTFGSKDVIAEYIDSYSVSYDFYDTWRSVGEKYPHMFEEKYAVEMGYIPFVLESIRGLLEKTGVKKEDIAKVIIDGPSTRYSAQAIAQAGFKPEQEKREIISEFGYSGAAYAPLQLAFTLEESKPGDLILYVSYGEGSDAILFKAMAGCDKPGAGRGLAYFQNTKDNTLKYEMMLKWKKMLDFEPPRRASTLRSSLSDFYRKRKKNLALYGTVCKKCGTAHYPPSRVCIKCKSIDEMDTYRFQGRKAHLATFTFDYVAFSEDAPNLVSVVDFDGGGRIFTQMVDYDKNKVEIGMPVEMVYRKLFSADGINTYSWKCAPVIEKD